MTAYRHVCPCCCQRPHASLRGPEPQPSQKLFLRRHFLAVSLGVLALEGPANADQQQDSLYTLGEINGVLNACPLSSLSCASTQNDDQDHFIPPWQYDGDLQSARDRLLKIATGEVAVTGLLEGAPGLPGVSRTDAAGFILEGVRNTLRGEPLPQRPTRQQGSKSFRFDAVLADQHTAEDGSQYMHFTFNRGRESGAVIDAEFLLLTGDNIVDIHATSRGRPGLQDARIDLSLSEGLIYERNTAKRLMEEIRKALRWENAPVLTDFDPRFNQKRLMFFERFYQPFLGKSQRIQEEPIYDK
ncbi:hypothetical protein CVIRNUC_006465 [Coccomyxa viridis]|uniref:Uncharacterized protein n=1 Tax=Coccomyxa viridis TaxID=1274662 RepID=A0AAV1I8U5_9CHLO|nr:hypothetical protein CVIRNUC_006465 [Coccomyxa viridis]